MALVPCETKQDLSSGSRPSSSISSPVRKRIIHNEIYSYGENTVVNSYSFSQRFNRDEAGRTFETTQIQVVSFVTPQKTAETGFYRNCSKPMKKRYGRNRILMSPSVVTPEVTGDHTSDSKRQSKRTVKKKKMVWTIFTYFFLSGMIAAVAYFYSVVKECWYVWDLNELSRDLTDNVFGQNEAINKVNSVLTLYNDTRDLQTIILTGGVGVGKSLTSSIISRNFPWKSNKLIIKLSGRSDIEEQLPRSFSKCGCNLIRVDDLRLEDVDLAVNLIWTVRSKMKYESVFLILIFNTHTDEEKERLLSKLKESYVYAVHIPFNSLTRDVVKQCYQYEIEKQGAQIPESEVEKLIDNKMKHVDVVRGSVGCKGVSEEVSFFLTKN